MSDIQITIEMDAVFYERAQSLAKDEKRIFHDEVVYLLEKGIVISELTANQRQINDSSVRRNYLGDCRS